MNSTRFSLLALLLIALCSAQLAIAQTPTTTAKRGFTIEYSPTLPNITGGKAPLRVRITRTPPVPSANDQSFNIAAYNGWRFESIDSPSVSAGLILPAGKTSAEVELLLDLTNNSYQQLLVEQGSRHTSSPNNDLLRNEIDVWRQNWQRSLGKNSWLLISSHAPNNNTASKTYYPGPSRSPRFANNSVTQFNTFRFNESFTGDNKIPGLKKIFQQSIVEMLNRQNWHALQPAELPETWVGLSGIDNVLISNDEFKSLTQVPAYQKLIERWVAAGGNLIVFNAKNSLSHADSVFPLLLGPERATQPRRWTTASTNKKKLKSFRTKNFASKPASKLTAKDQAAFSPYLNGSVWALVSPEKLSERFAKAHFDQNNPFGGSSKNSLHFGRNTVIPSVGNPPITLFGIITGFFLVLIGPVILLIVTLNNDRRFLFFFVPVFSFLTCTGILGYAVIADFNKQLGRTETITALDSRSELAFSKASSAYYCGNQPPYYVYDPITFVQSSSKSSSGFRIRQLPEEQRLSSPRIQPRTIHGVFTAKPYPTKQRFLVTRSKDTPNFPQVTNLLGSRINLAFFEYEEKMYLVRDLAAKQTAVGVESSLKNCREEFRAAITEQRTSSTSTFSQTANLEINSMTHQQTPRMFVATIDTNPAVDSITEPFDYKIQLHVVHGEYN